jgi:aminopeptidase
MDQRVTNLARILVNYSLEIKSGQIFKIVAEPAAEPLVKAVYDEALRKGSHIYVEIKIIDLAESLLKYGSDEQLSFYPPLRKFEIENLDAQLTIWGSTNTKYLSGVNPARQQLYSKTARPYFERFMARQAEGSLRWCGVQFPTVAHAQEAGMSLGEYEDFVYAAGHVNEENPLEYWQNVEKEQDRIIKILDCVEMLQVRSEGTDIALGVKGRKWINCCGKHNFPDGEIFTSPQENITSGTVRFTYPAFYSGREVVGVKLTFKDGAVVDAKAEKDEEYLIAMIGVDEGSKRLGEFAIGTNYEIQKFTKNTLFDEKIGGTCHMALGNSMPEAGGLNRSGIHWDMVNDLKNGGEILADGKVIYRDGQFII